MMKPMVVCLGILWGAASPSSCESTQQIASACDGGACPEAPARPAEGPQCVFSQFWVEVAAVKDSERESASTLCLPQEVPRRLDGGIECRMRADWDESNCARVGGELSGNVVPSRCWIEQITASQAAEGAVGWYFDDSSDAVLNDCEEPYRQRIAFTEGFIGETDASFYLACEAVQADAAAVGSTEVQEGAVFVRKDSCEFTGDLAGTARVGQPCSPEVPLLSYQSNRAYVEPNNSQCTGGVCLVYQLEGAIPAQGECPGAECATPEAVNDRVYCSCRCHADEPGDMPLCDCPAGFTCEEILERGPAAGSYCVNALTEN